MTPRCIWGTIARTAVISSVAMVVGCNNVDSAPPDSDEPAVVSGTDVISGEATDLFPLDIPDDAVQLNEDVPVDWQIVQADGLEFSVPPEYVDSPEGHQLEPRAIVALEGQPQDGVKPLLTVTTAEPGTTTDVDARTYFLLERLPDSLPGVEITQESRLAVPGASDAILLRYVYPEGEYPYDVVQAIIADGSAGWGVRYGFDSEFYDEDVANQILSSIRIVDPSES